MKDRYLIIADDFTGANDTGVQLRRRGVPVEVMFHAEGVEENSNSIVLDTESRGMEGSKAAAYTQELIKNIDFEAYQYVIKKVDSTLRGNVAEEIAAVDKCFKSELIIFAPALPDLNRTTEDGIQKLNGVPISETEMAKDLKKPVTEDNLKNILEKVFDEKIIQVGLEEAQNGFMLDGARIYTFDAILNSDLIKIISCAKKCKKRILWVGTAAIADNIMNLEQKTSPSFCVCGSVSTVTNSQVKAAELAGVKLVQIPIPEFLKGNNEDTGYVAKCVEYLKADKDVILLSSASYDRDEVNCSIEAGIACNMDLLDISNYTQNIIGSIAEKVLEAASVSGVFLTGGDTAIGFLQKIGAKGSYILSEIAVGIPMMQVIGGKFDGLKVITKAGAFGKEDAITYGLRKLKEQETIN